MTTVHDNFARFNYNMGLLRSRRSRIAHVRQQYIGSFSSRGLDFKECPPETLREIRAGIRAEIEAENRRQIIVSIVLLFAVALVVTTVFAIVFSKVKIF